MGLIRWTFRALVVGAILGVALAFAPGCALTDMTGETYAWETLEKRGSLEAEHTALEGSTDTAQAEVLANDQPVDAAPPEATPKDRTLWEVLAEFWSSPPVLVLRVAATIMGFVI
ncbi:MAG: hypothetical protein AAFU68_02930 [Pseudomonadota bacterium]